MHSLRVGQSGVKVQPLDIDGSGMARRWASYGATPVGLAVAMGWAENGPLDDVHILDERYGWQRTTPTVRPKARRWAASAVIDNHLVISGGYQGIEGKILADAWAYEHRMETWRRLPWNCDPRCRHTIQGGWVLGGYGERKGVILKTRRRIFSLDEPLGPPEPVDYSLLRAGHVVVGDNVVAGFHGPKNELSNDFINMSYCQ